MNPNPPVRVLSVGGDHSHQDYLKDLFSSEKNRDLFEVSFADSGGAALQQLDRAMSDLILVDISYPSKPGQPLYDQLHQRFPDIPKLVLIEVDDEPLAVEAMQKGAKGHLLKIKSNRSPLPLAILQIARQNKDEKSAIRRNEEFFKILIENASDIITVLDAQGVIHYQSPSFEKLFGYKSEDFMERNAFDFVHIDDLSIVAALFEESIKKPGQASAKARFRFRHHDGSWIYLEAIGCVVKDNHGQVRSVVNSRDVTEQVRLESELRQLSLVDPLTGLYNRRSFMIIVEQQLKKSLRSKEKNMHVIFIDMDGLKMINDRFGHSEGDAAIKEVAGLLRQTFRSMDVLARIGGDEFLVFLQDTPEKNIKTVLEHLRSNIDAWNQNRAKPYDLKVSIGVAVHDPAHPSDAETLIKKADSLMYEEKRTKTRKPTS